MNILVTGTRRPLVAEWVRIIDDAFGDLIGDWSGGQDHLLIHGDAQGVDRFVAQEALRWGWRICAHPADWDAHGKAAGPIRNHEMLADHPDIDVVLAFPSRDSRGTWDMVEKAVKGRFPVRVYPLP